MILRGSLLVSSGGLFDPNFRHTVILIADHSDEGTLGVVLNRPSVVTVEDAVPALSSAVPVGESIYLGGPVQPTSAVILADHDPIESPSIPIVGTIGLMTGEVGTSAIAAIRRARVFAGYAGWGAGQLEEELARDDWILEPARPQDVFTDEPENLWKVVLERKGGDHALLARMPFDPSTN